MGRSRIQAGGFSAREGQVRLDRKAAEEETAKAKEQRAVAAKQLMETQAAKEQVQLDRKAAEKAKRGAQEAESWAKARMTAATVHQRQALEALGVLKEWRERSVKWVERLKAQRREVEEERREAAELAAATDAPKMLRRAATWLYSQGHVALGEEMFVALDPETAGRRPAKEVIQVLALPDVKLPSASPPAKSHGSVPER